MPGAPRSGIRKASTRSVPRAVASGVGARPPLATARGTDSSPQSSSWYAQHIVPLVPPRRSLRLERLFGKDGGQPIGHGSRQPRATGAESVIALFLAYQLNVSEPGDVIRVLRRREDGVFARRDQQYRARRERAQRVRQ